MAFNDPFILPGAGGMLDPAAIAQQQEALATTPSSAGFFSQPPLVAQPSFAQSLGDIGVALVAADQGGAIAGAQYLSQVQQARLQERRQARRDSIEEYELMERLQTSQQARLDALRERQTIERLKQENPDLADLIDLDPKAAAKTIADGAAPQLPYAGDALEAQDRNVLLTGDPSSAQYAASYNALAAPKVTRGDDGTVSIIRPNMSSYRTPTFQGSAPAPTAPSNAYGDKGGIDVGDPTKSRIAGYDFAEGARPTEQDAKVAKDQLEAIEQLRPLFEKRRNILEGADSLMEGSNSALELQQNNSQILLKVKNLEQTGALDKGSIDVIGPAIGDPINRGVDLLNPISSSRKAYTQLRGGKDMAIKQLDSAWGDLQNNAAAAVRSRGYVQKEKSPSVEGGPQAGIVPQPTQAPPQGSRYTEGQTARNPQTGETVVFRAGKWRKQ